MVEKKKKFEACLLRITTDQFVVAEWHQLVTTIDKTKLSVGSSVGYKRSTNKREKPTEGTIMVIGELQYVDYNISSYYLGSVQQCQQQMKLFTKKMNKKKVEMNEVVSSEEEEEPAGAANGNYSSDSDHERSSESSDECLHDDNQEETSRRNQVRELLNMPFFSRYSWFKKNSNRRIEIS